MLIDLIQGIHLLALTLWSGGAVAMAVVLSGLRRVHPADVLFLEAARRRLRLVLWWAIVACILTLGVELAGRVLALHDAVGPMHAMRLLLFSSRYGSASVARWLLLVAALFAIDEAGRTGTPSRIRTPQQGRQALGIIARRPAPWRPALSAWDWGRVSVALALALLVSTALAGPFGDSPLSAAVSALHLAAQSLWLGGTLALALAVAPFFGLVEHDRRPMAVVLLLNRFGRLALVGGLVLGATGLVEAAAAHGHPALLLRAAVLLALVISGTWIAVVARPRLRRLALQAHRETAASVQSATVALLERVRLLLVVNAGLAAVALLCGVITDRFPGPVAIAFPAPVAPAASSAPRPFAHRPVPAPSRPIPVAGVVSRWQALGPTLAVHVLIADPTDRRRLFEGTDRGVYRSLDSGLHWQPSSQGLVGAARVVWSLTVLPDRSLMAATGSGVYRSTDNGAAWSAVGLQRRADGRPRAIDTIAVHRSAGLVLLVGGDGGIYRSDDLAGHWRSVYSAGTGAIVSLAWPSIRPLMIVAGGGAGAPAVVVSSDGGLHWAVTTAGLPGATTLLSVAVAPGAHALYAGTRSGGAFALSPSSDRWLPRSTGLPTQGVQREAVGSFAFDGATPTTLYVATDTGVYRSTDAGAHWASYGGPGGAAAVNSVALVTGPHPALYAATQRGLYRLVLPVHWAPR